MNEETLIVEDEFFTCVVKLTPVVIKSGLNIHFNRKMDVLHNILYKTFCKLNLKKNIEIVFTSLFDEYKYISLYTAQKLTQQIVEFLGINIEVLLLSKYADTTVVNPTVQELGITHNYFYMAKQGDILFLEGFRYNNIEEGLYENIARKIYLEQRNN